MEAFVLNWFCNGCFGLRVLGDFVRLRGQ